MSLLRVAFTLQNATFFNELTASLFFIGIYFDSITIAYLVLPILLFVNPFINTLDLKVKKVFNLLVKIYLALMSLLILVLNTWDIAYFSYTQKRSGFSYFLHLLTGTETSSLAGEFLAEFWWLPLLFLFMATLLGLSLIHI